MQSYVKGVVSESRDLLLELWHPLYISKTVEASNFKVGKRIDHGEWVLSKIAKLRMSKNIVNRSVMNTFNSQKMQKQKKTEKYRQMTDAYTTP